MKIEEMISNVFKKSFDLFKNQFVALIIGTLIAIIGMIFIITIPPLIFGIYYMCAQLSKGKTIQISDVFKGFNYFFRSWGITILVFLSIILGLILFVIPGLLLMILFQYVIAVAIIEDKGVIDSLKRSFNLAERNFSFSIILWILIMIISSIGALTRIGVLITLPFTFLVTTVATLELIKRTKNPKKETKTTKKKSGKK